MSTIISTKILAQWSDKDKLVKIQQDMPSDLQELFDNWLSDIETEKKEKERCIARAPRKEKEAGKSENILQR